MALDFVEFQVAQRLVPEYFKICFQTGTVHIASVVLTFYYFRMLM